MSHGNNLLRNSILAVIIGFLTVVVTVAVVLTLAPN